MHISQGRSLACYGVFFCVFAHQFIVDKYKKAFCSYYICWTVNEIRKALLQSSVVNSREAYVEKDDHIFFFKYLIAEFDIIILDK